MFSHETECVHAQRKCIKVTSRWLDASKGIRSDVH